jgi:hypothetical protein
MVFVSVADPPKHLKDDGSNQREKDEPASCSTIGPTAAPSEQEIRACPYDPSFAVRSFTPSLEANGLPIRSEHDEGQSPPRA